MQGSFRSITSFLSRGFLEATVHLIFFLAVMKILSARRNRDFLFTAIIAFLELLAAAILSANLNFFLFLALYLFFAMAAFTSSEIRRALEKPAAGGAQRPAAVPSPPERCLTAMFATLGILSLTAGLFSCCRAPPTPPSAPDLAPHLSAGLLEPGDPRPDRRDQGQLAAGDAHPDRQSRSRRSALKWRGGAAQRVRRQALVQSGRPARASGGRRRRRRVADQAQRAVRAPGSCTASISTHLDTDALFFAGTPGAVWGFGRPAALLRDATRVAA